MVVDSAGQKHRYIECLPSEQLKYFLPFLLILITASNLLAQAAESDPLEDFVKKYEETWQAHDAKRLADFFDEDSDMIVGIAPRMIGRDAIEASWDLYFSRIDSGRLISISIESIRILSPNVALLNVHTTTGGTHSQTNEVLESRKARGTWVVTRGSGGWRISALRAHSPVGELREEPGRDK